MSTVEVVLTVMTGFGPSSAMSFKDDTCGWTEDVSS